jgi:co-chaperonin GroES (HSP10)
MNPQVGLTKNRKPFPFEDRVILEELREEVSAGGIFIPQDVKEDIKRQGGQELKIDIGRVLAVGDGPYTDAGVQVPMAVKVGDLVAYARHKVIKYKLDGETYLIATGMSLIARISDDSYPEPE